MGTAHILEVLRRYSKSCTAVIITSDKCYDNVEWMWGYKETDQLGGKDIYSGSKGAAELVFKSYYHSFSNNPDILFGLLPLEQEMLLVEVIGRLIELFRIVCVRGVKVML